MNQKKQLETLEIVEASSKESLYEKLNDRFVNYRIVEETKKMKFPFFWKADYTLKVMVPSKVHIHTNSSEDLFSKHLEEKINVTPQESPEPQAMETVISPISSQRKLAKKQELMQKLDQAIALPVDAKKLTTKKEQEVELNSLKGMLEMINEKLNEKQTEDSHKIKKIKRILHDNDIEEAYAPSLLEGAESQFLDEDVVSDAEVYEWLIKKLQTYINAPEQFDITDNRVIAIVGQTGVGKTTTLVKIGWQLSNKNRSIGFITTDTFRSGAVQQLEGYAEKMEVELIVANGPEELREAINYFTHVNQVNHILIDTVGRNYMDDDSIATIKNYIESANPDLTCLAFSAVNKSKDVLEIISKFTGDEISGFIFTKLDETKTIGGLFSVFMETTKPVFFVTDGQDVTKNISVPTRGLLARRMFFRDTPLGGIF